jgi:hypothetical protein
MKLTLTVNQVTGSIVPIEVIEYSERRRNIRIDAKIDEGLNVNFIEADKAKATGYKYLPDSLKGVKDSEGHEYDATHSVELQWCLLNNGRKTYTGNFYITQIHQTRYDVILGVDALNDIRGQEQSESNSVRPLEMRVQTQGMSHPNTRARATIPAEANMRTNIRGECPTSNSGAGS